jgi:hypothetical protein
MCVGDHNIVSDLANIVGDSGDAGRTAIGIKRALLEMQVRALCIFVALVVVVRMNEWYRS